MILAGIAMQLAGGQRYGIFTVFLSVIIIRPTAIGRTELREEEKSWVYNQDISSDAG